MLVDHITSNILIEVATEAGVTVAEAEKVMDKYYKSVAQHKVKGEPKIKLDYLCSFVLKEQRQTDDRGHSNTGG